MRPQQRTSRSTAEPEAIPPATSGDGRPQFHSVRAVADFLGVCPRTVTRLIAAGQLKAHRIRRSVRISEDDLKAFLSAHRYD
jgi:excisionase family DNA binding protein